MFRFNEVEKILENVFLKFQYNTCLGSTFKKKNPIYTLKKFQYNTCLGSTGVTQSKIYSKHEFQYNTCLGSTLM